MFNMHRGSTRISMWHFSKWFIKNFHHFTFSISFISSRFERFSGCAALCFSLSLSPLSLIESKRNWNFSDTSKRHLLLLSYSSLPILKISLFYYFPSVEALLSSAEEASKFQFSLFQWREVIRLRLPSQKWWKIFLVFLFLPLLLLLLAYLWQMQGVSKRLPRATANKQDFRKFIQLFPPNRIASDESMLTKILDIPLTEHSGRVKLEIAHVGKYVLGEITICIGGRKSIGPVSVL